MRRLAEDLAVDGGDGKDTINFSQSGVVDLDDADFANVTNIEVITFSNEILASRSFCDKRSSSVWRLSQSL